MGVLRRMDLMRLPMWMFLHRVDAQEPVTVAVSFYFIVLPSDRYCTILYYTV